MLKPLFKLDPILPYAALYFCPRKDVTLLFDHVPVHLALGRIVYKLDKYTFQSFVNTDQVVVSICNLFKDYVHV